MTDERSKDAALTAVTTAHDDDPSPKGELVPLDESEFTDKEYKRLRLKFDFILLPMMMILYGLQYSDKMSLSAGVIFGLREDTGLVKNQYADLTTYFNVAYAIAQYPMAYALQRFPLGRSLAVCIIVWGAMVMVLAACNNYSQLSATRFFIGWFESVITPGFAIFTASWYLRREQTLRQMCYYAMNSFFSIIFGLGNYYVALNAQRRGGLAAWRVINLFLGGTTVGMGIVFLVFGGTPDEVWWLSRREKRMAKARIVSNGTGGGERHPWRWDHVKECLKDRQYWHAVVYQITGNIPNGGLTTFQTLIFKSFGFTSLETLLYSMPMYAVTFTGVITSALLVNKWPRLRFPIAIFVQLCTMSALLVAGVGADKVSRWGKFGAWTLNLMFSISHFIVGWPIMSFNIAGRTKKSFTGASLLFIFCIGNIIGANIFLPSEAPRYVKGLTVCAIMIAVNVVNFLFWWQYYVSENRRREAAFVASGLSAEERGAQNRANGENDLTDMQNPHFRYLC